MMSQMLAVSNFMYWVSLLIPFCCALSRPPQGDLFSGPWVYMDVDCLRCLHLHLALSEFFPNYGCPCIQGCLHLQCTNRTDA